MKRGNFFVADNNDMTAANLRPQTFEFTLSTYFGKRRNEGMRSLFD